MNTSSIASLLPLLLIFVVFYFLLIRPNQKRQRERSSMLSAIKQGDTITTIGGLHGVIEELNDQTVVLRAGNTKLTFERSAIASIVKNNPASANAPAPTAPPQS